MIASSMVGTLKGVGKIYLQTAIHLVFSLAKRWLLGTHHGAVRHKHLQRHLTEFVFRFKRRTAKAVSHGFARLIQHAIKTPPTTYGGIIHGTTA